MKYDLFEEDGKTYFVCRNDSHVASGVSPKCIVRLLRSRRDAYVVQKRKPKKVNFWTLVVSCPVCGEVKETEIDRIGLFEDLLG